MPKHFRYGGCSSVGRAPDCGSGCREFDPRHSPQRLENALVAQLDRAVDFESKGRRFESYQARHFFRIYLARESGGIGRRARFRIWYHYDVGVQVSPLVPKFRARIAQLVEHNLAKVGVAGSSPVSRSINLEY